MQRAEQRDEVEMLALMLLIRRFEERASAQYQAQKIGGFCHLYIGQEAVVVGAVAAVRDDDYIITAYRDHGHALARGTSANACMAELFGKATGCSQGLGGSMHFFDKKNHMYGGHAIVGAHVPLAAGMAFAAKYRLDDPIIRLRAQLTREGKLTNEQFDALDKKAKETVLASVKFAESSPELPVEKVYDYAYYNRPVAAGVSPAKSKQDRK